MARRRKKQRSLWIALGILAGIIAVLRFVTVNPHWTPSPRQPDCRAQVEAQWKVEGFDAVGKIISCDAYEQINATYVRDIKPIFAAKCLMCHGQTARVPLYAILPPTKIMVQEHRWEAQEHLDMSHDFPFKGHHTQEENLEDIKKVVQRNAMPPWFYLPMHWRSRLTPAEHKKVVQWVDASLAQMK